MSPQLVTIVGVPGIGKTRLVAELQQAAAAVAGESVIWRQGRSVSYGGGLSFGALAEMVKGEAGIKKVRPPTISPWANGPYC